MTINRRTFFSITTAAIGALFIPSFAVPADAVLLAAPEQKADKAPELEQPERKSRLSTRQREIIEEIKKFYMELDSKMIFEFADKFTVATVSSAVRAFVKQYQFSREIVDFKVQCLAARAEDMSDAKLETQIIIKFDKSVEYTMISFHHFVGEAHEVTDGEA